MSNPAPIFLSQLKSRLSEVSGSHAGVFHPAVLWTEKIIPLLCINRKRTAPPLQQIRKVLLMTNPFPKIQIAHGPIGQDLQNIANLSVKQMKILQPSIISLLT